MTGSSGGCLVVDVRAFSPTLRRQLIFALIDKLLEIEARDELVLICDHEPAGVGYQIDLRKESRGMFSFSYDQRSDGAWVALIRPNGHRESVDET